MILAVLDTNILVSAILSRLGDPARILEEWKKETFILVLSEPIFKEIDRVFHYPKIQNRLRFSPKELQNFLNDLKTFTLLAPGRMKIKTTLSDPEDFPFLIAAKETGADFLVTRDSDLLILKEFEGIKIITPRAFLENLRAMR